MATQLIRQRAHDSRAAANALAGFSEEPAVRQMHRYAELTGLPFLCVDAETGVVLAKSDASVLEVLPARLGAWLANVTDVSVEELDCGLAFFAVPLSAVHGAKTVGVGYVLAHPDARPSDVVLAAVEEEWSTQQLDAWLARQHYANPAMIRRLLESAVAAEEQASQEATLHREIDYLGEQIEQTFEEISLLHSITANLQISRSPIDLADLCLKRMHGLIRVAGTVVWLEERRGKTHFLVDGNLPFDEFGMARLIARFEDHDWSRPLVKNNVHGTLLGADFPGLDNFVIVSIAEGAHRSGWILSCNLSEEREFGTVEASLLNSIATILGTHLRNIDLYHQHDELLLSFVRSLVSTLDAKDPYTRGHSERVALIARRIGQELELPEDDLHDLYLSGLLHDIGKIGVNDRILQKPGDLTDEEFKEIQKHPMIGYSILSGLKNLQRVLPGVRNHHESYNGKGYPDRLTGEEIPLMARILAVADSYDAMGSDRPYRKGMPLESIETIFQRGAGNQWDAAVIDAYFRARDDIRQICDEYSPVNGNLLHGELADQYC